MEVSAAALEEIALEGLEGITISTLWVRLEQRPNFSLKLDDKTKSYIWRCVLALEDVEFFKLKEARPLLVIYNILERVHPETNQLFENDDDIPDDIYPISIVEGEAVQGSCSTFKSRTNVTSNVKDSKDDLQTATESWGETLVIVANQEVRKVVLTGPGFDPLYVLPDLDYCLLERLGRSRYGGQLSVGKAGLSAFKLQVKTIFYKMKGLIKAGLVKKQNLTIVRKNALTKLMSSMFHLKSFFRLLLSRMKMELKAVCDWLSTHPDRLALTTECRSTLNIPDNQFKKLISLKSNLGIRYMQFVDVPYRRLYPEARPNEFMLKTGRGERILRCVQLMHTLQEAELMDEEAEFNEEEPQDTKVELPKFECVYDVQLVTQCLKVIQQMGPRGLSNLELKRILGEPRQGIRRLVKYLNNHNYVKIIVQDHGRQKVKYVVSMSCLENNESNIAQIAEFQKYNKTPKKSATVEEIHLQEELPSDERATEIKEELQKVEQVPGANSRSLQDARWVGEEPKATIFVESLKSPHASGMKRFGNLLTSTHLRRANWIIEAVYALKVIETFRLRKLIRNREGDSNYLMDSKSMGRLLTALAEEGRIKVVQVHITLEKKERKLQYLCLPTMDISDPIMKTAVEQAKLKYFSISKVELTSKKKAAKNVVYSPKKKGGDTIPKSAQESILKHQDLQRKVQTVDVPMKFNKKAGKKYGLLSKMQRLHAGHSFLYYLCHDMYGKSQDAVVAPRGSDDEQHCDERMNLKEYTAGDERLSHWAATKIPPKYHEEQSWKRYLPPIPVHDGYKKGWGLLSDILLIMPVTLFCQLINVCYDIHNLDAILAHPEHCWYPIQCLPFSITKQLLHSKKYVHTFHELCCLLAEMGLLSFGTERLKEKDQMFLYVRQKTSLLDTRQSERGYNKTNPPPGLEFPRKVYNFIDVGSLEPYWEDLQIIARSSNLGSPRQAEDNEDFEDAPELSMEDTMLGIKPADMADNGRIPGNHRGAAGLDSSLFCHSAKNWSIDRSVKHNYHNKRPGAVPEQEVLEDYPPPPKKEKKKPTAATDQTKSQQDGTVKRVPQRKGKTRAEKAPVKMRACHRRVRKKPVPGPKLKKVSKRKPPCEKGDELDQKIYSQRSKLRVNWTTAEDTLLLMCKIACIVMGPTRKMLLANSLLIRDVLREHLPEVASDKTSQACKRRLKFILQNQETVINLMFYLEQARQDQYVKEEFMEKHYFLTDQDISEKFRVLVNYLLTKLKNVTPRRQDLPDCLADMDNFSMESLGQLEKLKLFKDVSNKSDICRDTLRNILHCAVLLNDKQGRAHEMYKLMSQYPDTLLGQVIHEIREDGMIVINKFPEAIKHSPSTIQSSIRLRNFKVSHRYFAKYHQTYNTKLFMEAKEQLDTIRNQFLYNTADKQTCVLDFQQKGGHSSLHVPLICNKMVDYIITVPEELVIVDMNDFYNFPWGRGKRSAQDNTTPATATTQEDQGVEDSGSTSQKRRLESEQAVEEDVDKVDVDKVDVDKEDGEKEPDSKKQKLVEDSVDTATDKHQGRLEDPNKPPAISSGSRVAACNISQKIEILGASQGDVNKSAQNESESSKGETIPVPKSKYSNTSSSVSSTNIVDSAVAVDGDTSTMSSEGQDRITMEVCSNGTSTICFVESKKSAQSSEQNIQSTTASRTLLSLRRSDDLSLEDLRIFNAQDNFVVNSCTVGVKLRPLHSDGTNQDEDGRPGLSTEESEGDGVSRSVKKCTEQDTVVEELSISKEHIKKVVKNLQKLLPFTLKMDEVWQTLQRTGTPTSDLKLTKHIYHEVDKCREQGIKEHDLKRQYEDRVSWQRCLGLLMAHNAVLRVGVTVSRYVSLRNCRPWVIHSYRNLKGRGLHEDEEEAAGNTEEAGPHAETPKNPEATSSVSAASTSGGKEATSTEPSVIAASTSGEREATSTEPDNGKEPCKPDSIDNNEHGLPIRRSRKRKLSVAEEPSTGPAPVSTYDKVRLVCHPWRKPEGTINKPALRMMMESVLLHVMTHPGSPEKLIANQYLPYLSPMAVKNILAILEEIGCVKREFIRKQTPSLFSRPAAPLFLEDDELETDHVMYLPTLNCLIQMAQFGREVFQNFGWPRHQHGNPHLK